MDFDGTNKKTFIHEKPIHKFSLAIDVNAGTYTTNLIYLNTDKKAIYRVTLPKTTGGLTPTGSSTHTGSSKEIRLTNSKEIILINNASMNDSIVVHNDAAQHALTSIEGKLISVLESSKLRPLECVF